MPPGFSEEQKALIEQTAWRVGEKREERMDAIEARLDAKMIERIGAHERGCPVAKKLAVVATVFALLGGGVGLFAFWIARAIAGT